MERPKITTDSFDNYATIAQIGGSLGPYKWFFHARSGHWEFHLVEEAGREPDCAAPGAGDYWEEGDYDSPALTNEEASTLVFACLRRYWETRGKQTYFRQA